MLNVYLAGGMRTGWQKSFTDLEEDEIYANFVHFIDPRNNGTKVFEEFTFWDMFGVEKCDLVFAYLEKSNPAGHAMMVEAGYALGLGKRVIFVNEQNDNKYTMFLAKCPRVIYFDNFDQGFNYFLTVTNI